MGFIILGGGPYFFALFNADYHISEFLSVMQDLFGSEVSFSDIRLALIDNVF